MRRSPRPDVWTVSYVAGLAGARERKLDASCVRATLGQMMEVMGHEEPATIARARGVQWAHEVRTIIIPSSMEWPWSTENGIELARQYVRDLADDPRAVESLAAIVLSSARQSWMSWRSESR